MYYNVSFTLTKGNDKVKMYGTIGIVESPAFQYGNGLCMPVSLAADLKPWRITECVDLRYDSNASLLPETEYIKQYIKNRWHGINCYKATYIKLKKV